MTGPLVSVSTPVAVRGALAGLGGQVDRDAARRRELEAALTFYADPESWRQRRTNAFDAWSDAEVDRGERARAVLAGEGGT